MTPDLAVGRIFLVRKNYWGGLNIIEKGKPPQGTCLMQK